MPAPIKRLPGRQDQQRSEADRQAQATKILVVLAADVFGGAEVQTRTLLSRLSTSCDVTLLTHARIAARFRDIALTLVEFEALGLRAPYYYGWRNVVSYADAIAVAAVDHAAETVYAVMHNSSLFAAAARILHPRAMWRRTLIGSLHGSLVGYFQQRGVEARLREKVAIRAVIAAVDSIVTPSEGVANELIEVFGARANRVHAIYNGFDLERIRELGREQLPREKTGFWIVTCCRLNDQKDLGTLINAFAQVKSQPYAKLIIVGDGPERGAIETLVNRYNLGSAIIFAGAQVNPFPWIGAADIFVLSSHYEGFGNVIVEALALGVPVIASDCPWGPSEIVDDGVSGRLFEPGDTAALVRHIDDLLDDEHHRLEMGRAASHRAEHFSQDRMARQYSRLFATMR